MATKSTMKGADKAAAGVDEAALKRAMGEIARQKGLASEYAGNAGKVTRDAIDNLSLDRKAFTFLMQLSKMDEAKRQATFRCLVEYYEKAGFLDQVDAFNDLTDQLSAVVERLRGRIPNRETEANTAAISAALQ